MYLDELTLVSAQVGYGAVGRAGQLGYEEKLVVVGGTTYPRALSAHPPSRLCFDAGGQFASLRCRVGLNDDVEAGRSHANFSVLADGRRVAMESQVTAGQPSRPLCANIDGAQIVELVVETSRWEYCHAVWIDPQLDGANAAEASAARVLTDCLGRAQIQLPSIAPRAARCIATVVSPGFEALADDMLGSVHANANCPDAQLVIFALFKASERRAEIERLAVKHRAILISCQSHALINPMSKAILYSAARVIDADYFVCLDADMLILGDLRPLFATLEATTDGVILACRESNGMFYRNVEHALCTVYRGSSNDLSRLLPNRDGEGAYPLVVNDGLFAGSRTALLALDATIRGWPNASRWCDERRDVWWRNQFVFNLALANLRCGVELDGAYNVQLCYQDVQMELRSGRVRADWRGKPARVLHFNGPARNKYPKFRNLFGQIEDPLAGSALTTDTYAEFLIALRAWIGCRGVNAALACSFYGNPDARAATVDDPHTLPLLAALHYLVRANGCCRVLETGTYCGVSAACLASAVAHRADARVVSFDVNYHPARDSLIQALPPSIAKCIDLRNEESLAGMRALLEAGETFQTALLDSLHTEEHVLAEFELARQLVCSSGLILVHDARLPHGTVDRALRRIEQSGFGVTRLWCADGGVAADAGLGLAAIENRVRKDRRSL